MLLGYIPQIQLFRISMVITDQVNPVPENQQDVQEPGICQFGYTKGETQATHHPVCIRLFKFVKQT